MLGVEIKGSKPGFYPIGWAFVNSPETARDYVKGLVDSPTDILRIKSNVAPAKLKKLADDFYPVGNDYSTKITEALKPILPKNQQQLLSNFPPYFVVLPKEFNDAIGKSKPGSSYGSLAFFSDTDATLVGIFAGFQSNAALIREDEYQKMKDSPALMAKILAHETFHYLGHVSQTRIDNVPNTLEEGIAEYFAIKALMGTGAAISSTSNTYPFETCTAHVLARIAGQDELTKAFFTGDFSTIRSKVDRLLGFGAWEALSSEINYGKLDSDYKENDRAHERFTMLYALMAKIGVSKEETRKELHALGKID